jgi:hypothetical protein
MMMNGKYSNTTRMWLEGGEFGIWYLEVEQQKYPLEEAVRVETGEAGVSRDSTAGDSKRGRHHSS